MGTPEQTPVEFERLDEDPIHRGHIFDLVSARFKHADGKVVTREIVRHPGAVAIVAVHDDHVVLVRQPREAIASPDLLELPAGRRDKDGEEPEATARRELAEEVGLGGGRWELLRTFWSSPGMTDEQVHVYLAEDLREEHADSGEDERITIVRWPLSELDGAISATADAQTLVGLLLLKERLAAR